MYKEIRLDLTSQRGTFNRIHLNQMLSLPLWSSLPTSGEALHYCRSMRKRQRGRLRLPLPDIGKLESWTSRKEAALLLVDSNVPLVTKTFLVELIDLILDSRLPIVWALRYAVYQDRGSTVIDLLRLLVLQ